MYLELHRGTYTSQARTKHGNRRSEHLLREAELWAATATVRYGTDYPYDRLEKHWHTVLLQQFHDILPGSSIAWVYRDAERRYADLAADLDELISDRLGVLAGQGDREITFNPTPHTRTGIPALGAGPTVADPNDADVTATEVDGRITLANGLLRVVVDDRGLLVSVVHEPAGREVIPPGSAGNLLQAHRDVPNEWDAWDVDEHYRRHVIDLDDALSVALQDCTPDLATVLVTRRLRASTVQQRIALARGATGLELETTVDWHERQTLLKLAFPLDVQADRSASETQFGHVFRPTHTNTSWETEKFEICAHRWIHVGEPGFGVTLTNDRSYGHDVTTAPRRVGGTITTVRQSLLRAPRYPDPDADQGAHTFRASLIPGTGIAEAVIAGYRTNLPERSARGSRSVDPIVTVSDPGLVVEAVKLAEDRSGDVVVRLYESLGRRCTARVAAGFPAASVIRADLLERPLAGAPHAEPGTPSVGGTIALTLRPFELVTLRFTRH